MEAHNCKHAGVHVPYGIVMRRCHQLLGALLLPVRSVYKEQIVLPQSFALPPTCYAYVWVYICLFFRLCFSDEKSQQTEFTHAHYGSTVAQRRNTGRLSVIFENISKCFFSSSSLYRSLEKKKKKTVRDLYFEKLLKDDCCVCHLWLNYSADQVSIVIGQFCWMTNMIGQFQWNNRPLKLTGSNARLALNSTYDLITVWVCARS